MSLSEIIYYTILFAGTSVIALFSVCFIISARKNKKQQCLHKNRSGNQDKYTQPLYDVQTKEINTNYFPKDEYGSAEADYTSPAYNNISRTIIREEDSVIPEINIYHQFEYNNSVPKFENNPRMRVLNG